MKGLHTTFALVRKAEACPWVYKAVAKALGEAYGENTPISLDKIIELSGLEDALWALQCVLPEEKARRDKLAWLLMADYAEHVLPIFEAEFPLDPRPRECIRVSRAYALGKASLSELRKAREAAWDAGNDVWTSRDAWVARAVAWAARAATWDVSWAAGAARDATGADWAAEQEWQTRKFLEYMDKDIEELF